MKITIYWDKSTFTVEKSSTLKKDAAGSPEGKEISTKELDVTPPEDDNLQLGIFTTYKKKKTVIIGHCN